MKESKILKAISYLGLLLLISTLIISIFTISSKEQPYYNKEKYFKSERFVDDYMSCLYNSIYNLIHNNDSLYSIYDGEIEIHYSQYTNNYLDVKDRYFLIIYQNKALTNVELTNTTNTLAGIKNYIESNENAKTVNIINGDIQSESDIIQKFGIQYLDTLSENYYTIELNDDTGRAYKNYKIATVNELQIYSSYVEDFKENTQIATMNNLIERFSSFEKYAYSIIPLNSLLIVLILLYLIISIGYKKGVDGIALNDFDKIPLETILVVAIAIGVIPVIILSTIYNNYNAIVSLMITIYLLIYILGAIVFNTIIKRIKAKTLVTSTLCGIVLKGIINKIVDVYANITYSTNVMTKIAVYIIIIGIYTIINLAVFGLSFVAILLELLLMCFIAYKIIKALNGFAKIELKLKKMYEGDNSGELNEDEFNFEFKSTVKYINDISNGFENAIQDRIRSERLKAELITNVSHDIKTPLTSIINYVDLLKQEDIQNEKAKEYIGILDNKSQRLKKLTEDLVEASKVSTGNISLNLEKINVVQLIKQALGEFEDKFKNRGLDIILDSNDNHIVIKADNRYMYRIIENLFSNISKYALENSRVYVDIKKTQKSVIIEMKNISKDRLNITADELMQRFVRGDKSRTTEGSGLGISIAQNLTELQGGEFRLKLDGDLFKVELEWDF